MEDVYNILFFSIIGSFVALGGGIIFLIKQSWADWLSKYSIPFAAGVLITVSILGLLPEAIHMAGDVVFTIVLFSFMGSYLFEHLLFGIHHHEEGEKGIHFDSSIPLVIVGDTIHNFIDGVAIAATYLVNPGLGLITTISTFLHEVPHEIGDFGILLKSGWKRRWVIIVNIVSAAFTVGGAMFVLIIAPSDQFIGTLLAIATGLFLYLGASDFLPRVAQDNLSKNKAVVAMVLGVLIMFITLTFVPHDHVEETHQESVVPEQIIPTGSLELESY